MCWEKNQTGKRLKIWMQMWTDVFILKIKLVQEKRLDGLTTDGHSYMAWKLYEVFNSRVDVPKSQQIYVSLYVLTKCLSLDATGAWNESSVPVKQLVFQLARLNEWVASDVHSLKNLDFA